MCPVTVMPKWESAATRHNGTDGPPLPFDASKPNIARAYDYMLGRKVEVVHTSLGLARVAT
jgi:hypothetical protein